MKQKKIKPNIGDIVEIQTPRGFAYAQYTHRSPRMGDLIRVLPGVYEQRPSSFDDIVASKERYFVFYPLGAALTQKLVTPVGEAEVPEEIQKFPLMRMAGLPDREGKVRDWWLFDGKQERPAGELTPELVHLSIAEVWGHPLLVDRITEDWSPSQFGKEKKIETEESTRPRPIRKRVNYYLYFPNKAAATKVSEILKGEGLAVEMRRGANGNDWLVLASSFPGPNTNDKKKMIARLEHLATAYSGRYDGEETAL